MTLGFVLPDFRIPAWNVSRLLHGISPPLDLLSPAGLHQPLKPCLERASLPPYIRRIDAVEHREQQLPPVGDRRQLLQAPPRFRVPLGDHRNRGGRVLDGLEQAGRNLVPSLQALVVAEGADAFEPELVVEAVGESFARVRASEAEEDVPPVTGGNEALLLIGGIVRHDCPLYGPSIGSEVDGAMHVYRAGRECDDIMESSADIDTVVLMNWCLSLRITQS